MLKIINTLIASLSLGLFCLAFNFYISLHLGYEFVIIAISLEIASFLISIALIRTGINLKNNIFVLIALAFLMLSSYLLFIVNFVSVLSYFIALLCVVVPVVLLGLCIIQNSDAISINMKILSVLVGFVVAVVAAFIILDIKGLWMIFSLSAVALTLTILLMTNVSSPTKIAALCLLLGGALFINNGSSKNQLANWSLSDGLVTKPSLNLLLDPERYYLSLDAPSWESTGRVDTFSSRRSRNEGYIWAAHNATNSVPFVDKTHESISWWNKHYPLMMLPFELKKPSKVLTISAAKGPDVGISEQLYGAETSSIYNDCASLKGADSCDDSALNIKLEKAIGAHTDFDLVSFSIPIQVSGPYVGSSASHEAIHTIEVFQKLYDSLNKSGLMVVNTRDQVMLHKTLSYVWRVLSGGANHNIINYENNIRVLQLNERASYKDTYNYLVLVSKQGFTSKEILALNDYIRPMPITKVIYDSANNISPYIFFKQLDKIKVSDAVLHLTRASSWKYKKLINLEPSSIFKPDYFHLTGELHPFIASLSAIFLFLGIYGLFFSHPSMRRWVDFKEQNSPVLSVLLFQSFLCTAAFTLLLYAIVNFSSASLGYSSNDSSILMVLALAAITIPYTHTRATKIISKGLNGIWFYFVIISLCIFMLFNMAQDIEVLFGLGVKIVIFILIVMTSFFTGLVHRQAVLFTGKLYPDVWFWFWYMTSVGVVLGTIIAQYIIIKFDLPSVVQVAIGMFLFSTIIAWWCLLTTMDKPETKVDLVKALD